jgi:phosphate transport system substrate-binding protein
MRHLLAELCKPFAVGFFFTFAFAMPDFVLAGEIVRINGTGAGLDAMRPLIAAYQKSRPGTTFSMTKPLGSSGALRALMSGALDIAVTSKPLTPVEIEGGAVIKRFGKTPLAIVTGETVPVIDVTTKELEDIYSGVVNRWSNGEMVRVVLRPLGDIDTLILRSLSPGMDEAITKANRRHGMIVAVTDPESNEMVGKTPGSIGTSGLSGILAGKVSLRTLTLNGIKPGLKTLRNGTYPLAKELHFAVTRKLSPAASGFLDFVYSAKGRAIAEKYGVLVGAGTK